MIQALEQVLQVDPGHLTETVGGQPRSAPPEAILPGAGALQSVLREMNLHYTSQRRRLMVHDTTVIGADRRELQCTTRQVVRAEVDGVDRWDIVVAPESGQQSRVEPIAGMELGECRPVPGSDIVVVEALLPRPLARGEVHYTEPRTVYGEGGEPCTNLGRLISNPTDLVVMEVHFQGETPQRLYRRHINADAVEVAVDQELPLAQGRASLVLAPPRLGGHLVEREW